jgi:hypothetical protein
MSNLEEVRKPQRYGYGTHNQSRKNEIKDNLYAGNSFMDGKYVSSHF